jgi:hypothetical protein
MALLDVQNLFSDKQNLAQAAGNYLSTNSIDLGVAGTNVNGGTAPFDPGQSDVGIFARVVEAFATGTSVQAQLVTGDGVDVNGQINSGLTIVQQTDVIPTATLVLGYRFRLSELPPGITKRYLAMRYVLAGASAFTTGKITSGIALTPQAA